MQGVPGLPPPLDSGCFGHPRRLLRLNPQSQQRAGAQFQDPHRGAQGGPLPGLRGWTGEAGPSRPRPLRPPPAPLLPTRPLPLLRPPPLAGESLALGYWPGLLLPPMFPVPADVAKATGLLGLFSQLFKDRPWWMWSGIPGLERRTLPQLPPPPANRAFVASLGLPRPARLPGSVD